MSLSQEEKDRIRELLPHIQQMYFQELSRREEIEKRMQVPIPILIALVGGMFYLEEKAKNLIILPYLLVPSAILIGISLCYFALFSWPRNYRYMSMPVDIYQKYKNEPQVDLEKYLLEQYTRASNGHREVNKKRSDWYAMGMTFLIASLVFESVLAFFFILSKLSW